MQGWENNEGKNDNNKNERKVYETQKRFEEIGDNGIDTPTTSSYCIVM